MCVCVCVRERERGMELHKFHKVKTKTNKKNCDTDRKQGVWCYLREHACPGTRPSLYQCCLTVWQLGQSVPTVVCFLGFNNNIYLNAVLSVAPYFFLTDEGKNTALY